MADHLPNGLAGIDSEYLNPEIGAKNEEQF